MGATFNSLRCDGCGFPASSEHIARRLARLELATQFRPIRIHTLFVGLAPNARMEDDFYRAPGSTPSFENLLEALDIHSSHELARPEGDSSQIDSRLVEFQRRGYYLAYVSECPLESASGWNGPDTGASAGKLILNLGPALVSRIQLNYRPGRVVLLVRELDPLRGNLAKAGAEGLLVLADGKPVHLPVAGDRAGLDQFRGALRSVRTSSAATSAV